MTKIYRESGGGKGVESIFKSWVEWKDEEKQKQNRSSSLDHETKVRFRFLDQIAHIETQERFKFLDKIKQYENKKRREVLDRIAYHENKKRLERFEKILSQ